jgi:hypothetical protein
MGMNSLERRLRMKRLLRCLTLLIAVGSIFQQMAPAQNATGQTTITENYYKCIPGHQQDFLQLFMKNHYPLFEKGLASGRLISVRVETPAVYMPEDVRWDYRVTIKSKGPSNPGEEAALKQQLWPDQETFKREEKQRFDAVLAHWDITVTDLTPQKK